MKDYQIRRLNKFRDIEVFSLFFISFAGKFLITNKFFGKIKVRQQRIKFRYCYLNEFNYKVRWKKWQKKWETIKIL